MMNIPEILLAISGSVELSIAVKATVLLALGLTVARLAARARASVRHLVLGTSFAALLALPLVSTTGPRVTVDLPVTSAKAAYATPAGVDGGSRMTSTAIQLAPPGLQLPSWPGIARTVWVGGGILQFLFLGLQLLHLRRIRRSGIPWPGRRQLIQSLAVDSGVRRPVNLLLHEHIVAPITYGGWHPVVLLPSGARSWSEGDLRRALVHELEHVRRCDWAMQLAARAAVACYWFHPLIWMAWQQLCLEAERAADDAVLRSAECTEYAEQLIGLARRMSDAQARPALGMANRSDLSARVSALLDNHQQRGRAGSPMVAGAVAAAGLVLIGLAPLTAVAQSSDLRNTGAKSRRVTALDRALYEAAAAGDLEDIDDLLKAGANVNAAIQGDGSPLIGAARNGKLAAVVRLLDRGADPNMPVSGDGNPLVMAAAAGHADVVSLLLDRGARIDEVVPSDENALIQASGHGHLNVVKLLVSRHANVNTRLWVETSGVMHGVVGGVPGGVIGGVPGGVQRVGQLGGEWRSPLTMARKGGHQAVIDFLIASGARE
jgi:beta-lactamase regulating signal transducer with metallopeptidase domain